MLALLRNGKVSSLCPFLYCSCPFFGIYAIFPYTKGTWTVRRIIFIPFLVSIFFSPTPNFIEYFTCSCQDARRMCTELNHCKIQFNAVTTREDTCENERDIVWKVLWFHLWKSKKSNKTVFASTKIKSKKFNLIWFKLSNGILLSRLRTICEIIHKLIQYESSIQSLSTSVNFVSSNTTRLIDKSSKKSDKQMTKMKQKTI